MPTVTKREIAERIAAKTGRTQVAVKQIIQLLFEEVVSELGSGSRLEFRDFGVFEVVQRKPRTGRNPRTGQRVGVPAKCVVTFKMGKMMKDRVSGLPVAMPEAELTPSSRDAATDTTPPGETG